MLSMLRKTTASVAKSGRSRPVEEFDVVDDLTTWEFVNASQSDDEDLYSFDGGEVVSDEDEVISEEPGEKSEEEDSGCESRDFVPPHDVICIESLSVSPPMTLPVDVTRHHAYRDDEHGYDEYKDEEDEEDDNDNDDENDVYNDDVDDELVPWKLKDRFGKQRIRKLGKRGGPKVNKSKRLPYYHNRPGCLYGKHGLGVQHSYI